MLARLDWYTRGIVSRRIPTFERDHYVAIQLKATRGICFVTL